MTRRRPCRVFHVPSHLAFAAKLSTGDFTPVPSPAGRPLTVAELVELPSWEFFDVIHLHTVELASPADLARLVGRAEAERRRLIFTVHDLVPNIEPPGPGFEAKLARVLGAASQVATLTSSAARALRTRYVLPEQSLVVVPHGASISAKVASGWTTPGDSLAAFGALRPNRDFVGLLRGWQMLPPPRPPLRLLVRSVTATDEARYAGQLAELRAAAQQEPDLHLEFSDGLLDDADLARWLAAAHALVLPYTRITHSGQLELARDLGLPVLAPDVATLRAQLSDTDDTGHPTLWFGTRQWTSLESRRDLLAALPRLQPRDLSGRAAHRQFRAVEAREVLTAYTKAYGLEASVPCQAMATTAPKVSLTGIKPTGEPHLGNLIGAIRPGLALADEYETMYFIADYHALTTIRDPKLLAHFSRSVAATWLAAGLDPDRTLFYRQSDVPEVFEMTWVLACLTPKGLMNRAHAYKAALDNNREAGRDPDAGVNMGLYNYPILMAVDILIADADVVPVGSDQVQHVEIAADIAGVFNHAFGDRYRLKVPQVVTPKADAGRTLPGLDGRKMSKSYGNTIPLFVPEAELRKLVRRIATDSVPVEAPKDPDSSSVFQIFEQFAEPDAVAAVRKRLEAGGMGWGELKDQLFEVLNEQLTPLRKRYQELMDPDSELDDLLTAGAEKARKRARPILDGVRSAIGI